MHEAGGSLAGFMTLNGKLIDVGSTTGVMCSLFSMRNPATFVLVSLCMNPPRDAPTRKADTLAKLNARHAEDRKSVV